MCVCIPNSKAPSLQDRVDFSTESFPAVSSCVLNLLVPKYGSQYFVLTKVKNVFHQAFLAIEF